MYSMIERRLKQISYKTGNSISIEPIKLPEIESETTNFIALQKTDIYKLIYSFSYDSINISYEIELYVNNDFYSNIFKEIELVHDYFELIKRYFLEIRYREGLDSRDTNMLYYIMRSNNKIKELGYEILANNKFEFIDDKNISALSNTKHDVKIIKKGLMNIGKGIV